MSVVVYVESVYSEYVWGVCVVCMGVSGEGVCLVRVCGGEKVTL